MSLVGQKNGLSCLLKAFPVEEQEDRESAHMHIRAFSLLKRLGSLKQKDRIQRPEAVAKGVMLDDKGDLADQAANREIGKVAQEKGLGAAIFVTERSKRTRLCVVRK